MDPAVTQQSKGIMSELGDRGKKELWPLSKLC